MLSFKHFELSISNIRIPLLDRTCVTSSVTQSSEFGGAVDAQDVAMTWVYLCWYLVWELKLWHLHGVRGRTHFSAEGTCYGILLGSSTSCDYSARTPEAPLWSPASPPLSL